MRCVGLRCAGVWGGVEGAEEMGGGLELMEAEALGNELAVDALFEDGPKEEEVKAGEGGGADFFEGVAGGTRERREEAGGCKGVAGVGEGGGAGVAREVDAVCADGCSDGGGAVEEDLRWGREAALEPASEGGLDGIDGAVGEGFEVGVGEVFFADLDEVCLPLGEAGGVGDEGVLALLFLARKHMAVGDGVAQHPG